EDLSLAVARCLEKDPENRWPSADALRRALESRNMAGYRPTGLGWRAQSRQEPSRRGTRAGQDRPAARSTGRAVGERSPRPLAGPPVPRSDRQRGLDRGRPGNRPAPRDKGNEVALPETGEPLVIRQARAEFAKFAAVFGGCFLINIATGIDTPWSLFVGGAMSFTL